jgi:hypothetical protein
MQGRNAALRMGVRWVPRGGVASLLLAIVCFLKKRNGRMKGAGIIPRNIPKTRFSWAFHASGSSPFGGRGGSFRLDGLHLGHGIPARHT